MYCGMAAGHLLIRYELDNIHGTAGTYLAVLPGGEQPPALCTAAFERQLVILPASCTITATVLD